VQYVILDLKAVEISVKLAVILCTTALTRLQVRTPWPPRSLKLSVVGSTFNIVPNIFQVVTRAVMVVKGVVFYCSTLASRLQRLFSISHTCQKTKGETGG
jgi:ABC-type polysaccharide/polyol phosphate export permease